MAGAPGGGYDLRWEDMTFRDQILENQNWDPWEFAGPRTLKTVKLETFVHLSTPHSPLLTLTSHPHLSVY